MYSTMYDTTYIINLLIMLAINTALIFKMSKTEGFRISDHWFLGLMIAGELCNVFDLLCVVLEGNVSEHIFYILNAIYYLSYITVLYILLRYTKKICTEESYFNGRGNRIIALIPFAIAIVLIIASYWNGLLVYIDSQGIYRHGKFYFVYHVMVLFFIFSMLIITVWFLWKGNKTDIIVIHPLFYILPILIGYILQAAIPQFPGNNSGLTCSYLIIFTNYYGAIIRRTMAEKNVKVEAAYYKLEEQYSIVEALSAPHRFVYFLNMKNGLYFQIKASDEFQGIIPEEGNAVETLRKYITGYVSDKHQDEMFKFTDIQSLNNTLEYEDHTTCEYQRKDGGWRRAIWTVASRNQEGKIKTILFSIMDITKEVSDRNDMREQLEKALMEADSATKAKSEFLHSMSHDIRTPMNAILGYAQLMKREAENPKKITEYLEKLNQAGQLLLSLINNVLDMSRIESGNAIVDEEYNYMGTLTNDILDVFQVLAEKKNITLKQTVDVHHHHVLCDKTKVSEIMSNLISNAVKYTTDGGSIDVSVHELPSDKTGYATIQTIVEDTGIGMSKEYLPHIFDAFSREQGTVTKKVTGTGLGMPIVKKLIELMGGTIEVESELGKGTKFTVILQHRIADKKYYEQKSFTHSLVNTHEIIQGKSILLAEDNDLNAEIAIAILEDKGFLVDRVDDGIKCVAKMEKEPTGRYDLILMDIQMPNMDGYKATKIIRQFSDKEKAEIPILAMTANAFEEDRQNALAAGMNGHIAKPIEISKLLNALAEIL